MAAIFDFETERTRLASEDAYAEQALGSLISHANSLGPKLGTERIRSYQRRLAAAESVLLAERVNDNGDTSAAESILGDGKTSRREQKRRAKRAKAVAKNKALADKMAKGDMSEEQVDVIADASAKTDGAAAVDDDLIDEVASVDPDQGRGIADKFVADHTSGDKVQSEHDRQRKLRRVSKYTSKRTGLDVLSLEGDSVTIKNMYDRVREIADSLYQDDGGRDVPLSAHPRTNDQRMFDAAAQILTAEPVSKTSDGSSPKTSKRVTPRQRPRARIVVGLTVDRTLGLSSAEAATQHGLGLIPDSVLADYAQHADFVAALFDRNGEPLWLARLNRSASETQRLALVLRDRCCVLCSADHAICDVHHIDPFNAPIKGKTDLDRLVLLCPRCHRKLHSDEQTIYRDLKGRWRTRPATPDEIAPRPPRSTSTTRQQE